MIVSKEDIRGANNCEDLGERQGLSSKIPGSFGHFRNGNLEKNQKVRFELLVTLEEPQLSKNSFVHVFIIWGPRIEIINSIDGGFLACRIRGIVPYRNSDLAHSTISE